MHAKRLIVVAAITAAVALSAMMAARADSAAAKSGTRIAVVDVSKVLNQNDEVKTIEADFRTRQEALQHEAIEKENELKNLKTDLDIIAKGTPDYAKKLKEAEKKTIELQVWREVETTQLRNDRALLFANLYRKMLVAIEAVAQDPGNSYDLVLFKEQEADFAGIKPEAIATFVQVRKVLYADKKLDITDQVRTKMNNDFKNGMGSRGPTTAPAL